MMNRELEVKLIEVLDRVEAGETLPATDGDLTPYLHVIQTLQTLASDAAPSGEDRSRQKMLTYVASNRRAAPRPFFSPSFLRAATIGLIVLILFAAVGAHQAQAALPGSALYGLKRGIEAAQYLLAPDTESKETLQTRFDQERINEIRALLASGSEARVQFKGVIEALGSEAWTVSGIEVHLAAGTIIEGQAHVGATVQGSGWIANGFFNATHLIVEDGSAMPPQPVPPTATQMTPSTKEPIATATLEPTQQNVVSSPTLDTNFVPSPTFIPIPPTAIPAADQDGDGIDDEHDNCVSSANSDQADLDEDGRGDACDDDSREDSNDNGGGDDDGDDSGEGDGFLN